MVGRCAVNKSACFLTFSLALLTILLFDNLTSSNSADFNHTSDISHGEDMDSDSSFGIVIDAGSTGSRLFLYSWHSLSVQQLVNIRAVLDQSGKPVVKKVTPGLSSFADHPEAAPDYIRPLLDYASGFIPNDKHAATPVFIFATAGMRLLPVNKQNQVMDSLRNELPRLTKLQVTAQHIQVISGKWEGIYSWIAINYMLGRFNMTEPTGDEQTNEGGTKSSGEVSQKNVQQRPKTAGMIDMGGASAQIAFEIPQDGAEENAALAGGDNIELVNLGSPDEDPRFRYRLFVTTFLGFGVNEGAKRYEKLLWKRLNGKESAETNGSGKNGTRIQNSSSSNSPVPFLADGCMPVDMLKLAYIEEDSSQFVRKGNGDWDSCVADIASLLFDANSTCPAGSKACFFGGVQAPASVSLSKVELYGFSEYWFSVEDVLALGGKYEHDQFEAKAKQFCKQTWRGIKTKVHSGLYPKADSERLETQCFKSAWIHAVLHNGFHVDEMQHHFQSAFRINGQEVQWALGAIIYQMRYFPLLAEKHSTGINKISRKLHGNSASHGWTVLYMFGIVVVLAMLARMYFGSQKRQRISTLKRNSGQPRYWRLDETQSEEQLTV